MILAARIIELQVYNRYGQLVFATTDPYKCWDKKEAVSKV